LGGRGRRGGVGNPEWSRAVLRLSWWVRDMGWAY